MLAWVLVAVFVALQVVDVLTTLGGLSRPGAHEANPVMAWVYAKLGVLPSLLGLKALFIAVVIYATWRCGFWVPVPVIGIYVAVVIVNLNTMLRLGW